MDLKLHHQNILVTASSRGLGKAVALSFAQEGANVIICSKNAKELNIVAKEIEKMGRKVLAIPTDLTDYAQVKDLVSRSIESFRTIDVLITNCGGPPSGNFLDFNADEWRKAIDLNLMSAIYLCREVIPHMLKQNGGRIIMITSVSVKQPMDGLILSNVSRPGVVGLAKSLSNEFGKNNILVNVVCPGYTKTRRVLDLADSLSQKKGILPSEVLKEWERQNALKRIATPSEFADVVVFLASGRASHITGVTIQIDGGYVKSLF
jgi:3-oxoacyl-[acyl-carrier protein] reductase